MCCEHGSVVVAIEATANALAIARIIEPHVRRVVLANPKAVRETSRRAKTDKIDAKVLAQLLAVGFLDQVWTPDEAARTRRRLISRRCALVRQRTREKNQIHAGVLYAATNATLEQLTRGWAAEFGSSGVRVNAVSPGVTMTGGTADAADTLQTMTDASPAGRPARPEEIAAAVVYLASDDASYLHGTTLVVDGGALATR